MIYTRPLQLRLSWEHCDSSRCYAGRLGSNCSDPECDDWLCVLTDEKCGECDGLGGFFLGAPAAVEAAQTILRDVAWGERTGEHIYRALHIAELAVAS